MREASINTYERPLQIVWICLVLSLLVHIGVMFFASSSRPFPKKLEPISNAVPVELIPSPKYLETIDTLQEAAKEAPEDAKFASDRNLKTDEETSPDKSASSIPQMSKGGAKSAPMRQKQEAAEKAEEEGMQVKERTKKKFSVSQQEMRESGELDQATLGEHGDNISSAGFNERLKKGEQLKANAREFDYGNYILRMLRKLTQTWTPQRTVSSGMYQYREIRVDIAVVLNNLGEIVELRTTNHSLFPNYDQEAIRALTESGPYPNPPKSLIQDDNLVYIPWSFVLTMDSRGIRVE